MFYLVFVAENYGHPSVGDKPVALVGLRLQLENEAGGSLSAVSATQAALLALGGVEATLSTVNTMALLPGLADDETYGHKRDQVLWAAWVFDLIFIYVLVTYVSTLRH